jgi:hypothetical protein
MIVSRKIYCIVGASGFPPVIQDNTPYPQVQYSGSTTFFKKVVPIVGTSTTYGMSLSRSWCHNCVLLVKPSTKYYYRILATTSCVSTFDILSLCQHLFLAVQNRSISVS